MGRSLGRGPGARPKCPGPARPMTRECPGVDWKRNTARSAVKETGNVGMDTNNLDAILVDAFQLKPNKQIR